MWTDDDAAWELTRPQEASLEAAGALILYPRSRLGLRRRHLRIIDGFLPAAKVGHAGLTLDGAQKPTTTSPGGYSHSTTPNVDGDDIRHEHVVAASVAKLRARNALRTVAQAGLLLPPGGVVRTRWRSRDTVSGGSIEVDTREAAEAWTNRGPPNPYGPNHPSVTEHATVTTWPDGTTLTGPWVPTGTNELEGTTSHGA